MEEKLKEILQEIEHEKGEVSIFAILNMDEYIDKWTIVLSAAWASDSNRAEIFNMIRDKIIQKLSLEEVNEISRIAIYPENEHFIQELRKFQSGTIIENKQINGNKVHYANIFKQDREERVLMKVNKKK